LSRAVRLPFRSWFVAPSPCVVRHYGGRGLLCGSFCARRPYGLLQVRCATERVFVSRRGRVAGLHPLSRGKLFAVACPCIVFFVVSDRLCRRFRTQQGGMWASGCARALKAAQLPKRRARLPYWLRCPIWWASRRFACVQVERGYQANCCRGIRARGLSWEAFFRGDWSLVCGPCCIITSVSAEGV